MNMIIAPSILSMDFSKMSEQIEELNNSKAEAIHFDVMDGHFVPNLTFGPDILRGVRKASDKFLDVHLMVTDPAKFTEKFIQCGANQITFHAEAVTPEDGVKLVEFIHKLGARAGVSIKPATGLDALKEYLDIVDTVLVMTVEPGFGGQAFMEDMMGKVRALSIYRDQHDLKFRIEVDGGINDKTIKTAKESGADMFVAGSYVFKYPEGIKEGVESLL